MKILFITTLLGKEYGGAEVSTRLLLDSLIKHGEEVQALTTRKVNADKRLISLSYPVEIPKKLLTLGNRQLDYFLARKIKKQIELFNPDVIHIQDTYILPATVLANKTLKVPNVATVRNSVLDNTWELMFPFPISTMLKRRNKTIMKALDNIDCIIAVSQYIKNEMVQRGIDDQKIFKIYNLPPSYNDGDLQSHVKHDSVVHLFAPGFLIGFKGFSVLIEAMKKVIETNSNVDLTIAGDGPDKRTLRKMASRLSLNSYVKFTGKISFENLFGLYSHSDIVIFPSIYPEPLGRVPIEAMFFGKPVVASRVGGIPEVVDDKETGLLVSPGNPQELAESITALVRDSGLRELMGKNGKSQVFLKFNSEKIVDEHLQVYELAQRSISKRN